MDVATDESCFDRTLREARAGSITARVQFRELIELRSDIDPWNDGSPFRLAS